MHLYRPNRFETDSDGSFTFYNIDRSWAIHYKVKYHNNGFDHGKWMMLKQSGVMYVEVGREASNPSFNDGEIDMEKWKELHNELWVMSINHRHYPMPLLSKLKRYNTMFNFQCLQVDFEMLDARHQFLKMVYANHFTYIWKYFIEHYELRFKPVLKEHMWARQMLLTFVTKFNHFLKLWNNKKFRWIIEETPHYYIQRLRWLRKFNKRDWLQNQFNRPVGERTAQHEWVNRRTLFCKGPLKNQKICPLIGNPKDIELAWEDANQVFFEKIDPSRPNLPHESKAEYDRYLKTCSNWALKCWKAKCGKRKGIQMNHDERYGRKVVTKEMLHLFLGMPCIIDLMASLPIVRDIGKFTDNKSCIKFRSYHPRIIFDHYKDVYFEANRMTKVINGFSDHIHNIQKIDNPVAKEQSTDAYIKLFKKLRDECYRFKDHRSYKRWISTLEKYRFQLL